MSDAMTSAKRMSVFAIDVGTGTQDILLYENGRPIENCEKMVMPSKTMMIAKEVGRATAEGHDIMLTGTTMGGGPCTMAIRRHLDAGFKVYATPAAAKTIHDDLKKVQGMGVRIVDGGKSADEYKDAVKIRMQDVDISSIGHALSMFDVVVPQHIAVAVQDHGESLDGNRIYRFKHLKKA
ncbi:MAG: pyruvate formate lyase-activating protein, partial [Methanosarcinales archaeon]|nr:pyruvate formate lyase-activating protein [Methanosarcinales archaeon]